VLRVFLRINWSARLCANSSFKPTAEVGLGFSDKQPRGGGLIQVLAPMFQFFGVPCEKLRCPGIVRFSVWAFFPDISYKPISESCPICGASHTFPSYWGLPAKVAAFSISLGLVGILFRSAGVDIQGIAMVPIILLSLIVFPFAAWLIAAVCLALGMRLDVR
jgi:hypothetical protein